MIRKRFHIPSLVILPLIVAMILVGCSGDAGGNPSKAFTITCEVFYRAHEGDPLDPAPTVSFTGGSDQKYLAFVDMTFHARYQEDNFEGKALYVSVTGLDETEEFSRQLYQFDPEKLPENQFIGGHGFTGLNYVYHPFSGSEMQYYCTID